jgi:hypothetical protein
METLTDVTTLFSHIQWTFVLVIVISSVLIKKLVANTTKIGTTHAVFFWSTAVALIYMGLQFLSGEFKRELLTDYFFSYLFASSFYDLLLKPIMKLLKITENEPKQ